MEPVRTPPRPNYIYLTPLFLAFLPLIRIAFKKQPVLRDRLFYGTIALGVVHGVTLISTSTPREKV